MIALLPELILKRLPVLIERAMQLAVSETGWVLSRCGNEAGKMREAKPPGTLENSSPYQSFPLLRKLMLSSS